MPAGTAISRRELSKAHPASLADRPDHAVGVVTKRREPHETRGPIADREFRPDGVGHPPLALAHVSELDRRPGLFADWRGRGSPDRRSTATSQTATSGTPLRTRTAAICASSPWDPASMRSRRGHPMAAASSSTVPDGESRGAWVPHTGIDRRRRSGHRTCGQLVGYVVLTRRFDGRLSRRLTVEASA